MGYIAVKSFFFVEEVASTEIYRPGKLSAASFSEGASGAGIAHNYIGLS